MQNGKFNKSIELSKIYDKTYNDLKALLEHNKSRTGYNSNYIKDLSENELFFKSKIQGFEENRYFYIEFNNSLLLNYFENKDAEFYKKCKISICNRIDEICNTIDWRGYFSNIYESKKKIAPNWEIALKIWIDEIEEKYNSINANYETHDYPLNYIFETIIYNNISKGISAYLYDFKTFFIELNVNSESDFFQFHIKSELFLSMQFGFIYANMLPKLKNELVELQNSKLKIEPQLTETPQPIQNETKPYKLLYLLMEKFGMFEHDNFANLTTTKKAKLLSLIFSIDSESIRQDLSSVSKWIGEKDKKNELDKLIIQVNDARVKKPKKNVTTV